MTQLWRSWLDAQRRGLTQREHASELGEKYSTYVNQLRASKIEFERVPESRYPTYDQPLTIEGDAIVLLNLHIPFHSAEFINKCLLVARAWGIRKAFLGGDVLDLHAFNGFAGHFEEAEKKVISSDLESRLFALAEKMPAKYRMALIDELAGAEPESGNVGAEIAESRSVLTALQMEFDEIVWIMGNHEQRVIRSLERVLPAVQLAELFGASDPKWKVSSYFWGLLVSGGEEYQIEHPNTIRKGASKTLAAKYQKHIIMGHNHQFVIQHDVSGRFWAIEPGMCCDERKMDYASKRHSVSDAHIPGAVMVVNGKPYMLNDGMTDWDGMMDESHH